VVDRSERTVRSLWPLPGGTGKYLASLARFVSLAEDNPHIDEYVQRVVKSFRGVVSEKTARSYTHVAIDLGMLELHRNHVTATADGVRFAKTRDARIVEAALRSKIAGVDELLGELAAEPARIGELLPRMKSKGFNWTGLSQVRYRLRWLQEVGLVTAEGRARPIYALVARPNCKLTRRALSPRMWGPSELRSAGGSWRCAY